MSLTEDTTPSDSAGNSGHSTQRSVMLMIDALNASSHTVTSDASSFAIGWNNANFVLQSDPNLCWAATLAMAFRHLGWPYTEAQFAEVNRRVCGLIATRSATLNQIAFALTAVHTKDGGVWVTDPDGSYKEWADRQAADATTRLIGHLVGLPLPPPVLPALAPPLGGFSPMLWTTQYHDGRTKQGGMYPMTDSSSLLLAMRNRHPVIVGLARSGQMHVVLIIGITGRPGGLKTASSITLMPGETKLESVQYVDPLDRDEVLDMTGDEFLDSARFAFELDA